MHSPKTFILQKNPHIMASALAACTSATVRMYADRKEWALEELKIKVDLELI